MLTTPERRLALRDYLSECRQTTIEYIASRFGVCRRTVFSDLDYLETELSVPLIRKSGKGGYIRVIDGWYASRNYFSPQEESFLKSLMPGLQPEQKAQMEELLSRFVKPA